MSSGDTESEPSPIDATGFCPFKLTPRRFAICQMYVGPTSSDSCAYTVLSERKVACVIEISPAYEWSKVDTCHGWPSVRHSGTVHVNGAES